MVDQVSEIYQDISRNQSRLEERRDSVRAETDILRNKYLDLIERERQYHQTVKDYEKVRLSEFEVLTCYQEMIRNAEYQNAIDQLTQ